MRTVPRLLNLLCSLVIACTGAVSSPDGPSTSAEGAAGPSRQSDVDERSAAADSPTLGGQALFACVAPELRGQGQASMRRLTKDELLQSFAALAGDRVMKDAAVVLAAAEIPSESTGDLVQEFQNGFAFDQVEGIFRLSRALAAAVSADPAARSSLMGSCASTANLACATAFLDDGALRILKRPLDSGRREALLTAFKSTFGGLSSLQTMLARLLQAPESVFHVELPRQTCHAAGSCADDGPRAGRIALDDWSVAARVAYAFTGQGPDAALLAAAARGELRSAEQVHPHALRLLSRPAARRQLALLVDAWLALRELPEPTAVIAKAAGIDAHGLAEEARQEMIDFVVYTVLDSEGDARALLSARLGFPRSERMAKLYGSEIAQGDTPVELPLGHGGLLLRVAPLLSGQRSTSPIVRGVYVRKHLLCDPLPSPDFTVISERAKSLQASDPAHHSTREITSELTAPTGCKSCHSLINPIGFALEGFDALGRPRREEVAYDAQDREVARHPIDTQVEGALLEKDDPRSLRDAEELAALLSTSGKVRACIAERLFSSAQLRPLSPADMCAVAEVEQTLVDDGTLKEAWIKAVVNDDLFYRKASETP